MDTQEIRSMLSQLSKDEIIDFISSFVDFFNEKPLDDDDLLFMNEFDYGWYSGRNSLFLVFVTRLKLAVVDVTSIKHTL